MSELKISKDWVMGIAAFILTGLLGWVGTTVNGLQTKVAALEATQERLIDTTNSTLDALIDEIQND